MGKIIYKLKKYTNKSQINRMKYKLKKAFIYALPTPMKKPARLIFSLIGLWMYFNVMIAITGNEYLIGTKKFIVDFYSSLVSAVTEPVYVNVFIFILFILLLVRYVAPVFDDEKQSKSKSIYQEVNAIISILYLLITVVPIVTIFIN